MATCPRCGRPFAPDDAFCGVCGQDLRATQQPTQVMPPVQPGSLVQPGNPVQPGDPTQPPKKSRAGLIIGIVAGVLVLCGACAGLGAFGYFTLGPNAQKTGGVVETEPPREPTSAQPANTAAQPPATQPAQVRAFETPQAAVDAFYETLSKDAKAAAALFDTPPDLTRYGKPPAGYTPQEPVMSADKASLDVQEEDVPGGAKLAVTFDLRGAADGWHLVSLAAAATDDVSVAKLDETSAKKVVNDFYGAITQDKVDAARAMITDKGLEQLGGPEILKQKGTIASWQVINAGGTGTEYTVWTIIQSTSGPEEWVFTLGMDAGTVKITGWRYDENL